MELLTSKNLTLPTVYFITDKTQIKELPIGVPFIFGDEKQKRAIIRILEYEILYQAAVASGFPFNFEKILNDNGYKGLRRFHFDKPIYFEPEVTTATKDDSFTFSKDLYSSEGFREYIKDSAVYVDVTKLKELNIFPVWMDNIEKAVTTNINNFATIDYNLYNKKLEGIYGAIELTPPSRNLIIIDISGSIPKGVSSTCLALSKNLAESFYADILITGSISTLYEYENLNDLDVNTIYKVNGMNNDQVYFKRLVTGSEKSYNTVVAFGDNHSPGQRWAGSGTISEKDGKKMCKWKVNKIVSFHTTSTKELAGYARWFNTENIENIKDWVKYL